MATPSVLTVPSMYGDGILYSGPTVFSNELVINGDFQTDTDWTKGAGWTISGGTANASATSNTFQQSSATLTGGRKYRVEFEITSYTSGTLNVDLGSSSYSASYTSAGLKTVNLEAGGFNRPRFYGGSVTCSIDNVSVKEITQGSDFDFTRSTTGTRINEEGYIEDVPYNLLSYTEELTDSYWNKISTTVEAQPNIVDPKNGRGAFKVTDTSGGGTAYLHVPNIASGDYGRSIYARTVSGTGTVSLLSYYGNTNNLFTLTEQWQRFYVDSVTTATGQINFYAVDFRAGDLTEVLLYAPQMTKSPDLKPYLPTTDRLNLPRLNYPVYGGCPSLLVEPQRTNIWAYSNDLSQWVNSFSTDESNVAISPEGIQNAGKLIDTTSTGDHYISTQPVSIAYDTITANSVFVKKGTFNHAQVRLLNGTGTFSYVIATFNLDTGELLGNFASSGTANTSYKIEKYPNDWWRITLSGSFTNSNVTARRYSVFMYNGTSNQYTGTGNDFIYIYSGQIEVGSYATSLIHTSGSTVTRNEDKAFDAGLGTTDTFNDSEGVLYLESKAFIASDTNRFISISDGSYNNVISLYYSTVNNQIVARTWAGGSSIVLLTSTLQDVTQFHKIAFSYKSGNYKFYIDGVKLQNDTNASVPTGLNQLDFFQGAGGNNFFAKLKALAVYKTALTDTELANLTSYNNHDLFIPYRSRMQMIGADQELQCTKHDITRFL